MKRKQQSKTIDIRRDIASKIVQDMQREIDTMILDEILGRDRFNSDGTIKERYRNDIKHS